MQLLVKVLRNWAKDNDKFSADICRSLGHLNSGLYYSLQHLLDITPQTRKAARVDMPAASSWEP